MKQQSGKLRILFLCTGNSCRSQMAEGWARQLKGDSLEPYSAGIAKHGLNPNAVKVMAEAGVDISGHRSKHVSELKDVPFDYVVTVCGHANESCPVFPGKTKVVHVGFDDPPALAKEARSEEEALGHYRRVRDEIRAFVEKLPGALTSNGEGTRDAVTPKKKNVVFLCTSNSCRSQMAEAFLRKRAGERFVVYSAGLRPEPIHPLTYRVMNEVGIDLAGHYSKGFREFAVAMHFLIIVCDNAEKDCPHTMPCVEKRLFWPFEDPTARGGTEEERLEVFREVRDQIEARILSWLAKDEAQGSNIDNQG